MKVTLNWLKPYVDFDWSPEDLAERLTMLGLEVEGAHTISGEFEGIVVAQILSRDKVPGSDKLDKYLPSTRIPVLDESKLFVDQPEYAMFLSWHIGEELVHHSDRGVQYTSICYTQRLEDIGAVRSVGSKGDSYDNAAAEAVNSLYKKELINREGPWQDAGDVTVATAEWVSWYNNERLHSACGNIPPAEYEKDWLMGQGHTIIEPEAKAS